MNLVALATDEWPLEAYRNFQHIEHARWATVFTELGMPYSYRSHHFGLNADVGMRPHFKVKGLGWFHCCMEEPSQSTQLAAQLIAERTDETFCIAQEPMFTPNHYFGGMPLFCAIGENCRVTRYLAEVNGKIKLVGECSPMFRLEVSVPRIRLAFAAACAIT